jgi:pyruvate ferredoxin oxidoreductase gamma subunit
MFQVRIHGRGGQGVVSAAEMLSTAAFLMGRHAQAFPSFGSERMGAPVVAFCRISDREIRSRDPVLAPNAVIIQDPTLLHQVDVFQGLDPEGIVLVNSSRTSEALGLGDLLARHRGLHVHTLPATEIALQYVGRPVPNVPLLGAFAALSGLLDVVSVIRAVRDKFPGRLGELNVDAATAAYQLVNGDGLREVANA